jgi:dCMP deaminase
MTRPSWEEYALLLANTASLRSEDPYIKCGACVLRHDNSVAGLGYNGSPPGYNIDWTDRDARRPFVSHAERSALRYCKPGEAKLIAITLSPYPN